MSDTLDIENGVLSFTNPNYHLDPSDVNSNPEFNDSESPDHTYDELYEELDAVCRFSSKPSVKSRRGYAQLDTLSMGVEPNPDPLTSLENTSLLKSDSENNITSNKTASQTLETNNNKYSNDCTDVNNSMGRRTSGFLDYYISLDSAAKQRKETFSSLELDLTNSSDEKEQSRTDVERLNKSPTLMKYDSAEKENSNNIPHVHGKVNDDLYAVPVKKTPQKCQEQIQKNNLPNSDKEVANVCEKQFSLEELRADEALPIGWERHQDDSGPYYWHISSGTIQREPPPCLPGRKLLQSRQLIKDADTITSIPKSSDNSVLSSSSSSSSSSSVSSDTFFNANGHSMEQITKNSPEGTCSLTPDKKPIRFAVRSMGWVEIAEEDLTPERSSKAVNKCIVDLSMGRNDILDVVGRWGDTCAMWQGKDLYMDLDDCCLKLTDPQDLTVLNMQPIHTIRVWGVGRDNGRERDFAYVARDRVTRKHMCHVFRCDIPARIIANTLRDICKKIMIERSLHQSLAKPIGPGIHNFHNGPCTGSRNVPVRPTNLPTEQRRFFHSSSQSSYSNQSFPTPMEEPKKVLKVHYLGTTLVTKALGIDVLNAAIDQLVTVTPREQYKFVNVAVAPSTISILEPGEDGKQLAECRVRFLSFLGIGRNVKHCAFIMHTAQDQFIAHVFHCEPSSGAMCKTIEAACKLRYQKCLDAHKQILERKNEEGQQNKLCREYEKYGRIQNRKVDSVHP